MSKDLICTNILKEILYHLMIHFFEGVSKFLLCSNKIGTIVTVQNPDVLSCSHKLSQSEVKVKYILFANKKTYIQKRINY